MLRWLLVIPFALLIAMFFAFIGLMIVATVSPDLMRLIGGAGESLFRLLWEMAQSGEDPSPAAAAVVSRMGLLMMAVTVFPVLVTALVCEVFRLSSGILQVTATGALTALLPVAMLGLNRAPSGSEVSILGGLFLIGVVAGTVYWVIAGRGVAARAPALPPPALPAATSPPPSSGS